MKQSVYNFLRRLVPQAYKPFTMFPYRYTGDPRPVAVGKAANGLPFAEYSGMRVYFPKDWTLEQVEFQFREYLEDEGLTGLGRRTKSPHCYIANGHRPERDNIIVDIGCSEGFFSRWFASAPKKLYLFEADEQWREPIEATFENYASKVVFTGKFVGAQTGERTIRLDQVLPEASDDIYFIKMDVEGAEREILESSARFLANNKIKLSCCAYHRQDDGRYLTKLLRGMGFTTRYSEGWMIPYDSKKFPFLRRGMIYASNC